MQPVLKLIGMNIKLARIKHGFSQAELAHKLGVEQSYISRIESGSVAVSCQKIYEVIHLLGCDMIDVFPNAQEVQTQFNMN
ncbi:helix-turn-helix transcriptional regulator [Pseudoalteromonas sp. K222D]|uniref:helix-turn-helix domain-containing protein n=1 Tax=Pseudoalteromonas sp. K222D TaxID=2820756 RepID=UPI001AD7CF1B|nr:helix-turn-helix transcriptional regulator [Pseudoalteromonas sp. K222D]MBO7928085.1 helix-turn-helix transcriptional regulator [Pseudoalteromonas sp. K222D]